MREQMAPRLAALLLFRTELWKCDMHRSIFLFLVFRAGILQHRAFNMNTWIITDWILSMLCLENQHSPYQLNS
jgi:hypothetical protein